MYNQQERTREGPHTTEQRVYETLLFIRVISRAHA